MIAISFKFLAGRYHATPWGRHVNEGAVEWPPSPWRILRALIATWKRTLPDIAEADVRPILEALANEPPEFILPPASTGHTRHYMPWFKKGHDDRTLVFDTFVVVSRTDALLARWPNASLDDAQQKTLARLLGNLNTLGRSESWVEAKLQNGSPEPDPQRGQQVSSPLNSDAVPNDHDIIRLLCPGDGAFTAEHFMDVTKKKPKRTAPPYDPDWHLCAETLWLHKEHWSDPPGSKWVQYARPRDCFKVEPQPRSSRTNARPRIQAVRYALDSTVLPLVTETLPIAEAARRTLMGIYGRLTEKNGVRDRSAVFSGKDEHGNPLVGHGHAYFLPTDEDGDDHLDHLTVFARDGFGDEEHRAFDRLRQLRAGRKGEERHPLSVLLLGMGVMDEYRPGLVQETDVWVSATPYIATRYAKTRGRQRIDIGSPEARSAFLEDDIRSQLAAVRPDLAGECVSEVTISPLWDDNQVFKIGARWRPIQFKRFRRKAGDDGGRRLAGAFRLTFPSPVAGPIALGWSSHFGMGLFMPSEQ